MTRNANNKANDTLYLDSYTLRHICNNKNLFLKMQIKNYKFIITRGKIIWS